MLEANLFMILLEPLNKCNIQYMVTGSVAAMIYGEPRITHDIDLVLQLHAEDISDFISVFGDEEFYCPPRETIETEIARETRGHFNIIHHKTGFKGDIYPVGNDNLHKWAMGRRQKVKVETSDIWLAPPEYVIVRKLEYYKEGGNSKHLHDIKRILEISGDTIDTAELKQKIADYNLSEEWKKLKIPD